MRCGGPGPAHAIRFRRDSRTGARGWRGPRHRLGMERGGRRAAQPLPPFPRPGPSPPAAGRRHGAEPAQRSRGVLRARAAVGAGRDDVQLRRDPLEAIVTCARNRVPAQDPGVGRGNASHVIGSAGATRDPVGGIGLGGAGIGRAAPPERPRATRLGERIRSQVNPLAAHCGAQGEDERGRGRLTSPGGRRAAVQQDPRFLGYDRGGNAARLRSGSGGSPRRAAPRQLR